MLEFIKSWSVNIVVLVMFIVISEMLLPKGRMKKYVNLVTGTILVIAIIEPVTGLFGKPFDFSHYQTAAAGRIDKKEIEAASIMFEEEQIKQTVRLYRDRLIEQIEYQAREVEGVKDAKADVILNEDHDSPLFGEIKRIYIEAEVGGEPEDRSGQDDRGGSVASGKSRSANGEKPDPVSIPGIREIDRIKVGNQVNLPVEKVIDMKVEEKLSERIENVFGISREQIIITQVAG